MFFAFLSGMIKDALSILSFELHVYASNIVFPYLLMFSELHFRTCLRLSGRS